MKIYAEILAGGKGERMGVGNLPKQFLTLGNKPVIIHTIEKFLLHEKIDEILVLVQEKWINHMEDILNKYISNTSKVVILQGGENRTETVLNGINYIENKYGINEEDIVITHDSVRPFITYKIIEDNINTALETGATDTVIPSTDTIVRSDNNQYITEIPNRNYMYQGQTPQTFNIKLVLDSFNELTDEQKEILTDIAKVAVLTGKEVSLVHGSEYNIKLTTPFDLVLAESILNSRSNV